MPATSKSGFAGLCAYAFYQGYTEDYRDDEEASEDALSDMGRSDLQHLVQDLDALEAVEPGVRRRTAAQHWMTFDHLSGAQFDQWLHFLRTRANELLAGELRP